MTTANSPERFPRYCTVCMKGVHTGFLYEDTGAVFCTVECASVEADDMEPLIYWADWRDIPLAANMLYHASGFRSDYDDMPTPDDDPHAEFTDDGAYYPDAMTTELVADSPSGRISVVADDIDACQLLASVGIILAKGGR